MADPYAIRNTRGDIVATIETGNRDTTQTSLVLHGRGAPEYGLDRDQNLVYLLHDVGPFGNLPSAGIVAAALLA